MSIRQWLMLALACGAAIVGLVLAASQSGTTGTMIGLDLFVVAVIYAFWLVKQHFDRVDRMRR